MNTDFESNFGKILVINRDARTDRWNNVESQIKKYGLRNIERFSAHEVWSNGELRGDMGCTASHRACLDIAAYSKTTTLIFEDDFEIVEPKKYAWDHNKDRLPFREQWARIAPEVPDDFDMLFLGGHYGEPPVSRHSRHIIRCGRMLCATAYVVNWKYAKRIAPLMISGAPDSYYASLCRDNKCYIVQPRLFIQYFSPSDFSPSLKDANNGMCMLDPNHERMV